MALLQLVEVGQPPLVLRHLAGGGGQLGADVAEVEHCGGEGGWTGWELWSQRGGARTRVTCCSHGWAGKMHEGKHRLQEPTQRTVVAIQTTRLVGEVVEGVQQRKLALAGVNQAVQLRWLGGREGGSRSVMVSTWGWHSCEARAATAPRKRTQQLEEASDELWPTSRATPSSAPAPRSRPHGSS